MDQGDDDHHSVAAGTARAAIGTLGAEAENAAEALHRGVEDLQERIQDELTRHPLRTLAAAAAAGFLLAQRFR